MADEFSASVITFDAINGGVHDNNSAKVREVSITPGGEFPEESIRNLDRITGGFVKLSFELFDLALCRAGHNFQKLKMIR